MFFARPKIDQHEKKQERKRGKREAVREETGRKQFGLAECAERLNVFLTIPSSLTILMTKLTRAQDEAHCNLKFRK